MPRPIAWILLLAAVAMVVGCQSPSDPDAPRLPPAASGKGGSLTTSMPGVADSTNAAPSTPTILPASGRVHTINAGLRFVVIDYTLGGMPPLQSLLSVFRSNERVGEIRLTGPERNGFVAADILEGFLQIDDEVRLQ